MIRSLCETAEDYTQPYQIKTGGARIVSGCKARLGSHNPHHDLTDPTPESQPFPRAAALTVGLVQSTRPFTTLEKRYLLNQGTQDPHCGFK